MGQLKAAVAICRWRAQGASARRPRAIDVPTAAIASFKLITGGFNVYPAEIESHIDKMPGVVESAVVGVPHPDFGEGVVAAIVPLPGHTLDEATLLRAIKDELAGFKCPKRIFSVAELPRNAMGKVQKNVLRQQLDATFANA